MVPFTVWVSIVYATTTALTVRPWGTNSVCPSLRKTSSLGDCGLFHCEDFYLVCELNSHTPNFWHGWQRSLQTSAWWCLCSMVKLQMHTSRWNKNMNIHIFVLFILKIILHIEFEERITICNFIWCWVYKNSYTAFWSHPEKSQWSCVLAALLPCYNDGNGHRPFKYQINIKLNFLAVQATLTITCN